MSIDFEDFVDKRQKNCKDLELNQRDVSNYEIKLLISSRAGKRSHYAEPW